MGKIDALEFLKHVLDLPWKTVIIHGRTFKQGFSGPIDFSLIKKAKTLYPDKIIIANGEIYSPENAKNTLEKTKADGIAVATGALGRPWIFKQIKDYLRTGQFIIPSAEETKKVVARHAEYYKKYKGDNFKEFRKHLGWYFKRFPGAKEVRRKLFSVKKYKDVMEVIKMI